MPNEGAFLDVEKTKSSMFCNRLKVVYHSTEMPKLRNKRFLGERYTLFSPTYLMRGGYGEENGEVSPID